MRFTSILNLLIFVLAITNCETKKNNNNNTFIAGLALLSSKSNSIKVNNVTDLTNESKDNYDENTSGLITGSTLAKWVTSWKANKPSNISGKLVILQTDSANRISGDVNSPYIKEDPSNGVYVYLLDDYQTTGTTQFRFNQARDSGLFKSSVRYQANGAFVDEWLKTFGINPTTDLIVFAVGTGGVTLASGASSTAGTTQGTGFAAKATGAGPVQDISRGYYWLRYWGVESKNLAILNGNIRTNFAPSNLSLLSTTRSAIPNSNNNFSVKQIRIDNTALTLGLEDIYEIAKANLNASNVTGITSSQFLVDARPEAQFLGNVTTIAGVNANTYYITTSWEFSGAPNASASPAQKFVSFEGGIKGAVAFPWVDLLTNSDTGFQFLSKSALKTIFTNKGYTIGKTVISQCRTNFEAQVNGFAALNILGYPTAYYDGSLVEWTSLVAGHPSSSINTISSSFKWRTDSDSVSRILWYNGSSSDITRVQTAIVNSSATTTKQFIIEDKAYKQ
jgi:thiosulfate/3-mercaptopyruvate sulfurtransferase